jgi:CrcB protein
VTVALVAVAGSLGALARYAVDGWIAGRVRGVFPWGTFAINATGSFLLGFVFTLMTERFLPHPSIRTALTVGFVGAYTTFSTLSFETWRLIEDGAIGLATLNVIGSVGIGLAAVYLGVAAGRAL